MELNAEGATVDLRCADLDQLGERFVQARIGYCFADCSQGCYYGRRCPGEVCVFPACLHPMRSPRWAYLFRFQGIQIADLPQTMQALFPGKMPCDGVYSEIAAIA